MTADNAWDAVEKAIESLDPEEKARMAAFILNELDGSLPVNEAFLNELDDNQHDELVLRAVERDLSDE